MKTLLGTLLALGLLSTAASAQWCPPGYGYGQRTSFHQPHQTVVPQAVIPAPAEPAPAPAEPVPAQPQEPAPEDAPPK